MEFRTPERIAAEAAATRLFKALERVGVILDDIHIDEPCKRCAPRALATVRVALGNLHVDQAEEYAAAIERLRR